MGASVATSPGFFVCKKTNKKLRSKKIQGFRITQGVFFWRKLRVKFKKTRGVSRLLPHKFWVIFVKFRVIFEKLRVKLQKKNQSFRDFGR